MPHVFVSHATTDDDDVSRICDVLTAAEIDTWVDHIDGIAAGDDWDRNIQNALNTCDYGLLVLSPRSAERPEIINEWRSILALGKRLYVALLEIVPNEMFPYRLRTTQYANLVRDFNGGIAELVNAIKGGRELDPQAPTTAQALHVSGNFPRWQLDLPLIGRDNDMASVNTLVTGENRVTAILGLGGVGKTRIAVEVATRSDFNDGVVWHTIARHTTVSELTQ